MMHSIFNYLVALFFLTGICLFISSCDDSDADAPVAIKPPEVTTTAVAVLDANSVISGGDVKHDGGSSVTARGVCWSLEENPTINSTATMDGSGSGIFESTITGLSAGTTYYLRAYATNEVGTAYGEQITFTTTPVVVFVGGSSSTETGFWAPTYWKDGTPQQLSDGAVIANGVGVTAYGEDVYVSGYTLIDGTPRATYWKNSTAHYLETATSNAHAVAVSVSGDVYVSGAAHQDGKWRIKYWKNGTPVTVGSAGYLENYVGLAVSGNDIYVCASIYDFDEEKWFAKYWKNGHEVTLGDGSSDTYAFAIVVSGNDVYVAGSDNAGSAHDYRAVYWKNGVRVALSDVTSNALARSLFVAGDKVYVAGEENGLPVYWHNGSRVSLSDLDGTAWSIAVSGPDIYVAGVVQENHRLMVWKNNTAIMDQLNAHAKSVFLY